MEIEQLMKDWKLFTNSAASFDESRFLTLFHGQLTDDELNNIFLDLPKGGELIQRYKSMFAPFSPDYQPLNTFPVKENAIDKPMALDIIEKSIYEKEKIVNIVGDQELSAIIAKSKNDLKEVDQVRFQELLYDEDNPNVWVTELIGDYFNSTKQYTQPFYYGLKEAFYGVTTDLQLTWYLMFPLHEIRYNTSYYFELWRGGWDYMIMEDQIVFSKQ